MEFDTEDQVLFHFFPFYYSFSHFISFPFVNFKDPTALIEKLALTASCWHTDTQHTYSQISRYTDTPKRQMIWYKGTQKTNTQKHRDTHIHRYNDTRINRHTDMKTHKHLDKQKHRQIHGHAGLLKRFYVWIEDTL